MRPHIPPTTSSLYLPSIFHSRNPSVALTSSTEVEGQEVVSTSTSPARATAVRIMAYNQPPGGYGQPPYQGRKSRQRGLCILHQSIDQPSHNLALTQPVLILHRALRPTATVSARTSPRLRATTNAEPTVSTARPVRCSSPTAVGPASTTAAVWSAAT